MHKIKIYIDEIKNYETYIFDEYNDYKETILAALKEKYKFFLMPDKDNLSYNEYLFIISIVFDLKIEYLKKSVLNVFDCEEVISSANILIKNIDNLK